MTKTLFFSCNSAIYKNVPEIRTRESDTDFDVGFEPQIDPDIGFGVRPRLDFDIDLNDVQGKWIGFLSQKNQNQTS
jgi:hypothetical protein